MYYLASGNSGSINYFIRSVPNKALADIVYTADMDQALNFETREEAQDCIDRFIKPLNHEVRIVLTKEALILRYRESLGAA